MEFTYVFIGFGNADDQTIDAFCDDERYFSSKYSGDAFLQRMAHLYSDFYRKVAVN